MAARQPEQILFFVPLLLVVITIAMKMDPGTVTLAWGIVGLLVIILGLLATQRSYRLTGLTLLVLCIGKIVFRDAWYLDERNRYITSIVLGVALILVSALYSKYRDQGSFKIGDRASAAQYLTHHELGALLVENAPQ